MMIFTMNMSTTNEKKKPFITSDKKQFVHKEEAEWHEFTVCQLQERRLTFEMPEHTIYTFTSKEEINRYMKECYGHVSYSVTPALDTLQVPNEYVIMERDVIKDGKTHYEVTIQEVTKFKQELIKQLLK